MAGGAGRLRVLVTGATGFVGRALAARLATEGRVNVRAAVRVETAALPVGVDRIAVGDLTTAVDWRRAVAGVNVVVHLAARVHILRDSAADPLAEFRRVNVAGTLDLAVRAAAAGVRRFLFLSSVKVHGESGMFTETDALAPADAYAISKHEAELGLREVAAATGMEVIIIRPPLVYGPGVRANFRALMRAVELGIPLPLSSVNNRRSLVAVDNLVDFILICMEHYAARNEVFLVSDGEDLSTPELIRRLAHASNRPARLFPFPPAMLLVGATLLGRRAVAQRLRGSLQVDITKARAVLGWTPPVGVDEGLRRAVAGA